MAATNTITTAEIDLLQRSNRLWRASTEAISILLSSQDSAGNIARVLEAIGGAADVDRVYIFENHPGRRAGEQLTSQRYEWTRTGVSAQIANPAMQNLSYFPEFKRWYETLSAGQPVSGLIRDFPEAEKQLLAPQDIVSLLAVPIKIREQLWGFIGFDDCRRERAWTPAETSILAAIAGNLGHIMLQRQTEKNFRLFQAAMDSAGDAIGIADMRGIHFYQNEAFRSLFGYTVRELQNAGVAAIYNNPAQHREVFKSILAGGSWHGEIEMRSRAGKIISVLLRADAVKDNDGQLIAVFGVHTDITARKETETALQEKEIRYRRLVEAITDYIYTVDVENGRAVRTRHGPNCVAVTGYSSQDYQDDQDLWFKMVHPDERPAVMQQAQGILNGKNIQPIEHRIYHKNGQVRWVRNTPVPHFDSSGRLVSYDGLVCDVTERKNAEEQLTEHARKLEILNRIITAVNRVDNLGMLLNELLKSSMEMVSFEGGGIYLVNSNAATAELVCHQGLPEDFLKKYGLLPLASANCRMLFLEGKPIFTDDYSTISSESGSRWNKQSVARIPLVCRDRIIGALVLVNTMGHTFNENEKGLLLSIGRQIGTAIAKMRSETALRESERKYRTITEQSLVGIQIIKDGLVLFVNDGWTKITGYSLPEITGWNIEEYLRIIHPEDRAFCAEQLRGNQAGFPETILPIYDCRFTAKTGETKWVSIHSRPVEFTDGRAAVSMIIDITDRKLAAAELLAANKQLSAANKHLVRREKELLKANYEKEILLKEIHHRVKNNLQVISSLINLELHNIADPDAVGLLKECQNRIKTIAMIHEKMYQWGDMTRIDIGNYLESLTGHISRMYLKHPASVTVAVNAKNVYLPINQAIPCALLANELVVNSLKHAFPENRPADGKITVEMKDDRDGRYVLTVSDNGIGLPAGIDCRKTKSLGMQLVSTFVNQLEGTLEITGGPGATFKIVFAHAAEKSLTAPVTAAGGEA
ncbi:MAG: PAS domain S-box protein [Kiritimatiellae bacterium]|nr:PAS domain S-box protein [Kiritimatiellia bacterium]